VPASRVTVVGAGVAGVAAARALADAGVTVTVLERGRVVGGRAASRTLHGRRVDLGAAYLTARDARFAALVADQVARGVARPWTDRFDVARADGWATTGRGPVRYGAPGGIRTVVEDLAQGLDVRLGTQVGQVGPGPTVDGVPVDAVVLAMPDPQAARLLAPELAAERAAVEGREWEPVLALAAGFPERTWHLVDGCFVDPGAPAGDVLAWVADDGRRRGDGAAVLVAHCTSPFAAGWLADPPAATPDLLAALRGLLGTGTPAWTHVHRWSGARPVGPRGEPFHLGPALVGLCGDGWGSPRLETGWVSGTALGQELAARLP
jgi:renalase